MPVSSHPSHSTETETETFGQRLSKFIAYNSNFVAECVALIPAVILWCFVTFFIGIGLFGCFIWAFNLTTDDKVLLPAAILSIVGAIVIGLAVAALVWKFLSDLFQKWLDNRS